MTDCLDARTRDLLPDYLHGHLDAHEQASVAAHLAGCEDCRAELALLARARQSLDRAPQLDVARIAAGVAAARPSAPQLVAVAGRPTPGRRWSGAPLVRAAAAVLLVAALGSLPVLVQRWDGEEPVIAGDTLALSAPASGGEAVRAAAGTTGTAAPAAAVPEITFGGGLSELSEGQLSQLISDLEALEAIPDTDPAPGLATEPLGDA